MKLKTFVTTFLNAILAVTLHAEPEALKGQLTLTVVNLGSNRGEVRIALFDSKETYTKTPVQAAVVKVENGAAKWTVGELQPGEFAIALFHDANGDGKLSKNIIGLPKEDYGFSNNASGAFGPPSWDQAQFTIGVGVTQHTINLSE